MTGISDCNSIKKAAGISPTAFFIVRAGEGSRTHTHEAPDPKSGLSTNFNTPAKPCRRAVTQAFIGNDHGKLSQAMSGKELQIYKKLRLLSRFRESDAGPVIP